MTRNKLRVGDEGYGKRCSCGKRKSIESVMCGECRYKARQPMPAKVYSNLLTEVWGMPFAFPPVVADVPRLVIRGDGDE